MKEENKLEPRPPITEREQKLHNNEVEDMTKSPGFKDRSEQFSQLMSDIKNGWITDKDVVKRLGEIFP